MEYEIEDEDVLFDSSANPSQKPNRRQSAFNQPPVHPRDSRVRQMGELIPEDEHLAA